MTTVGFIYPGHAAEDDYPLAEKLLGEGLTLAVEHIYGEDVYAVEQLKELGSRDRLADGVQRLSKYQPDSVMWAGTGSSFVYGLDGAQRHVDELSGAASVPASSTSLAFIHAVRALDLQRVAVSASYPVEVTDLFGQFLADAGIEVVNLAAAEIATATEVGQLGGKAVIDLIVGYDHPEAEAMLVPDTAMRTFGLVNDVEEQIGKPVLTANQVTIWEGLRLAGDHRTVPNAGALLRPNTPGRHAER
ncbi:MAG TPA: maleate cis-trans isomerase [Mycobacteriales bacterium]|jgi:maleate cis-trans isomerase|nr:maleate cis-trans isomerase [Mycobacteriales bacterium]